MRWRGRRSTPSSATPLMTSSACAVLPVSRCLTSASALSSPLMPSSSRACSTLTREPNEVINWSSRFVPSRRLPPDARPMSRSTSGDTSAPSSCAMPVSRSIMSCMAMRWKSNRWQRETMVGGSRSGSVVARTNTLCGGGSSSVLRNALNASFVRACASSMMYTLFLPTVGAKRTFSRRSRISSIPRLLAASTSIRSMKLPLSMARQLSHAPHGSPTDGGRMVQLSDFASTRAVLVLPVPRGPQKRYACAVRPCATAWVSVCVMGPCPTMSEKRGGRHFL